MSFAIYTAFPRGYCAGVHRAVGMLMEIVSLYPPPIYVNHEIIHNTFVVRMFERKGVVFEPDLEKIPTGSLVVISAHGTGPSYFERLRSLGMRWIDATCPLVEKVHREARDYIARGYHILYIGKEGHQEAVGVMDESRQNFTLIENMGDADGLCHREEGCATKGSHTPECEHPMKSVRHMSGVRDPEQGQGIPHSDWIASQARNDGTPDSAGVESGIKYAILTQTTLSVDDTARLIDAIVEKIPSVILPKAGDICYATTNRQRAVKALAEKVDVVIVVGSKNSSNSSKLRHVAEELGKTAYLVDGASDIDQKWFENCASVGITAGASGPEELIEEVLTHLQSLGGKFETELRVVEEKVEFPYTLKILS